MLRMVPEMQVLNLRGCMTSLHRFYPTLRLAAAVACTSLLMPGCQTLQQDRFDVQPSSLDYVQLVRTHLPPGDAQPETLRLELSGTGYLQFDAGRSERVRTGFWKDFDSPDWDDWRRDYVVLPSGKTEQYFQAFVDAGAFDQAEQPTTTEEPELAILIVVGNRKSLVLTDAPAYRKIFTDLLAEFER